YFNRLWRFGLLERRSTGRGTLEYRISGQGVTRLRIRRGWSLFRVRIRIPDFALTGERKAAILASDDWPASRKARRKKTEPSARRRRRRRLPRASAAVDVRCARRTPYRSNPPNPHARARRRAGVVRICLRARKTFF